jgi:hypothetical protein
MDRYNTFYNKNGEKVEIRFSRHFKNNNKITIRYTEKGSGIWEFLTPTKAFESKEEIISYIVKNTERSDLMFKVQAA